MLVGALLERVHLLLEGQKPSHAPVSSASGVSSLSSVSSGDSSLPLLQLPLLPFFSYESIRSVDETLRFRVGGLAILECLCLLERRHLSALHLQGGSYTRTLW